MMSDNPTPMQVVQAAYEKLVEEHKESSSKLKVQMHCISWNYTYWFI